jgi:chromosomal replication initiator protein
MQDVSIDDKEIVSALRHALAERVGAERYDMWFASSTGLRIEADRLIVSTANTFLQDWLRNNFRAHLEAAARETIGANVTVGFEVDKHLANRRGDGAKHGKSSQVAKQAKTTKPAADVKADDAGPRFIQHSFTGFEPEPKPAPKPKSHATGSPNEARRLDDTQTSIGDVAEQVAAKFLAAAGLEVKGPAGDEAAATSEPAAPTQAANIDVPVVTKPERPTAPRRLARFDEFVVGSSNRLAYASALGCAERLGSISPLVVFGPTGVGKTHLLEAMIADVRRRHPNAEIAMLSAEQFTTQFLDALHGTGLPSFRRKFRGLHLLIIDDLQFLAGKRATLVELVHTFDAIQRDGRQIVFAADRPPADLAFLGPELRNRISGGLVVGVESPDMQTRLGITGRMAARLGMPLADDVREFIAANFSLHARELIGALKRLLAAAHAFRKPIDRAFAEEALAELIRNQEKSVKLVDIEKAVCTVFGLETEALQSSRKGKDVSHPRMLAMWLARKYTRSALSEIGHYFGGRSHSTVISAQKKVTGWLASEEAVPTVGGRCRFDEALRRVEQTLLG